MTNLRTVKAMINNCQEQDQLFLSLIDEQGRIRSANELMKKTMQLKDPHTHEINFFDLVHPMHLEAFKKRVAEATSDTKPEGVEVYLKNGHYHPMKWKISRTEKDGESTYCCVGYKILDDQRLKRFNELVRSHHQLIMEGFSGILFQDKNGELIAANQKLTAIFNTTLENLYRLQNIEHLWKTQWSVMDEDGHPIPFEKAPFIVAIQTGLPAKKTLCIRSGNGEYKWVVFHSQALPPEESGGQPVVASSITDITAEIQLKRKLEDNEALVSAFFNETPTLSWVVDVEANVHFASKAFCDYFQISPSDFRGKKMSDLIPANMFDAMYKPHFEVFNTGKAAQTTLQNRMADGSNSVSFITIFPIHHSSGLKLVGGQAASIPDNSPLEKELRHTHERLQNLSKATSDAVWEWDMQTGKIFRNETLMEMIGYQNDNSKGLSWWLRRIHPEDRNRVADKVKDATENNQHSWQDEYRFKCEDGKYKHVRDKGFVVYENNLPVRMIGSLHDVSQLKELENTLADERVKRQMEITDTIIQVQEQERTRMGHELHDNVNQILSTAKLFVNMIKASGRDQKNFQQKSMEYIQMAVDEIRKLSKELVAPQLKQEKLTETIQRLVDDMMLTGAVEIDFAYDPDADQVSASKKITLFRVVQEQLKNILKHSSAKNVEILLRLKGADVELSITDNGKGFDPLQTPRGIGLSNIHERTKFHNGTVTLKAAKGQGCALKVALPLADCPA